MYAPSFVLSSLKIGKGRLLSRDQIMTNLYPWWCVVPLEQTNIPRTVSYLTEIITWRKGPGNKIKLINLFEQDKIFCGKRKKKRLRSFTLYRNDILLITFHCKYFIDIRQDWKEKIEKIYLIFFSILGIAKLRQHLSHLRFHRCWLQLECCSYNWLPWISPGTCWKMFGWPETVHIYSDLRLSVFQQRNTIFLKTDIGIEIQYCSLFLSLLFSSMRNFH